MDLVDLLRVHCAWGGPPGAAPADRKHHKVISAWAIHYSRRRQFAAEARARRGARRSASAFQVGFGRAYGSNTPASVSASASSSEAEAEKIVKLLQAHATAARAEAVWAGSTAEIAAAQPTPETADSPAPGPAATATVATAGWTEPLTSTWSRRALLALLIPALILLIVVLV